MMPNYNAGYVISSGFVAPTSGWVICYLYSSGAASYVRVNGRNVSYIGETISATGLVDVMNIVPVAKGQVVTANGNVSSLTFCPCFGA